MLTKLDCEFRWNISENSFNERTLNVLMYLIDEATDNEALFSQASIKINEIFRDSSNKYWLLMNDPDQV